MKEIYSSGFAEYRCKNKHETAYDYENTVFVTRPCLYCKEIAVLEKLITVYQR